MSFLLALPVLTWILKIAVYLAVVTAIVSLHEFGHFALARRFGVGVETFAVGLGAQVAAYRSRRTGTTYRLNVLPLGGYCRMRASRDADRPQTPGPFWASAARNTNTFESKPAVERLLILVAGIVLNLALAIPLFVLAYAVIGTAAPTVINVAAGLPAARAGIVAGDRIASVDGRMLSPDRNIGRWAVAPRRPVTIEYRHGAQTRKAVLTPMQRRMPNGQTITSFGIDVKMRVHRLSLADAVVRSGQSFAFVWGNTWGALKAAVVRPAVAGDQFAGPIGLARAAGVAQDLGWGTYATFAAAISIGLGVFNLLPIPGLDGGQIAFVLLEIVRGRPLSARRETAFRLGGIAIVLTIFAFTTLHDVGAVVFHR